jgi:hypothetical protein
MFSGIDKKTMLRRLRLLHNKKVLSRFVSSRGGEIIWAIHPEYARRIALDFVIKNINRQNLLHDLVVNDVRLEADKLGLGSHWKSSHYFRFVASQDKKNIERLPDTIPDWFVTFNLAGRLVNCALEVELHYKGKHKMERVLGLYAQKKSIGVLWYLVPNQAMKNKLIELGVSYQKMKGRGSFKVSLIDEFIQDLSAYSPAHSVSS